MSLLPYINSLKNNFVDYDDPYLLLLNPSVQNFKLINAFSEKVAEDYVPLVTATFAIEYKLFGFDPFYYHLTNVIFHSINAILVFLLLRLIAPEAFFAAMFTSLLFGIHPINVESVAWISQRKDMLCTFFSLLSLVAYFKTTNHIKLKKNFWFLLAITFFSLALFSKFMAITLPVFFFLMDLLKKTNKKELFFKLVLMTIIVTIFSFIHLRLHNSGDNRSWAQFELLKAIVQYVNAIAFYIAKIFYPTKLSAFYEIGVASTSITDYLILIAYASICFQLYRTRVTNKKWILISNLFFLITIIPISQILPFGNKFIFADRYLYLAGVGIFFTVGLFFEQILKSKIKNFLLIFAFFLIFSSMGYLTFLQTKTWKNSQKLWENAVQLYPDSSVANSNLAIELQKSRKFNESIEYGMKAIALDPKMTKQYINLMEIYISEKKPIEALEIYKTANANSAVDKYIYFLAGAAEDNNHNPREALKFYNLATQTDKNFLAPYNNIAVIYNRMGMTDSAISLLQSFLDSNPDSAEALTSLGKLQLQTGNYKEAIYLFLKVRKIYPDDVEILKYLAEAYFKDFQTKKGELTLKLYLDLVDSK